MKWASTPGIRLLLILLIGFSLLITQSYISVSAAATSKNEISKSSWKQKTSEYKFKLPPRPSLPKDRKKMDFSFLDGLSKPLGYVLITIVVILLVYFVIRTLIEAPDKKFKDIASETATDDDEITIESDLESLLKEALNSGNYRAAIRIYYLKALKLLGEKNIVSPSREKTNFEYLVEIGPHPVFNLFREMTMIFERNWFGRDIPSESTLNDYAGKHNNLQQIIQSNGEK